MCTSELVQQICTVPWCYAVIASADEIRPKACEFSINSESLYDAMLNAEGVEAQRSTSSRYIAAQREHDQGRAQEQDYDRGVRRRHIVQEKSRELYCSAHRGAFLEEQSAITFSTYQNLALARLFGTSEESTPSSVTHRGRYHGARGSGSHGRVQAAIRGVSAPTRGAQTRVPGIASPTVPQAYGSAYVQGGRGQRRGSRRGHPSGPSRGRGERSERYTA